jgi:hypothetical protein
MNPEKLNIQPLSPASFASKYPKGIDVLFNPSSYSITKPVTWTPQARGTEAAAVAGSAPSAGGSQRELDAPALVYGGGGSRTLTLQLFFDVTEGGADGLTTDVRAETNKIVALTRIQRGQGNERNQPPVCLVSWGQAPSATEPSDFPFTGVVTNLQQSFVLFRSSGVPVRANLTVVFTEYVDPEQNQRQTDPDLTTYVVKRGDTLSAIAATMYRDASQWRLIAAANGIDDPRHLAIGKRLSIPEK